MLPVFLECLTVDKDVIHIGSAKDIKDVRSQNIIDALFIYLFYFYLILTLVVALQPCRSSS